MLHCNRKGIDGLSLLIDFKKAFDSIDHSYIYDTRRSLSFGQDIISWMKLFLTERVVYILLEGHITLKILLEQGVPQGDIISPLLFIVAVEILLKVGT